MKPDRVALANSVLETFIPSIQLYLRGPRLRMRWDARKEVPRHDFSADLRSDGSWTRWGYNQRPTGGTGMQALAQLIRYVRDLPRLPLATWEYWAGERVKLCTPQTLELIRASDYGDPAKTRCVLCGALEYKRGLDWWSLDGVTGPSCYGGRCKDPQTTSDGPESYAGGNAADASAIPDKQGGGVG